MPTALLPLISFWHGQIGWMERICLASMLRQGHEVVVYSYGKLNLPDGVEARDARDIIPEHSPDAAMLSEQIAAFSDVFRYVLMERQDCIWVDLDIYLLQPIVFQDAYVFAWEKPDRINNAVLRLPPQSELLADLLAFARKRPWFAPWWRPKHKWRQRFAIATGRPLPLSAFPKAQLGPKALTYFAGQQRLLNLALPQQTFYPVAPQDYALFLGPAHEVDELITPETVGVHFWSSEVKRALNGQKPNPDSYIGRLLVG